MAQNDQPRSILSPEDKALLAFIISYLERHCYQPTTTEMADHMGVTKNAIAERLNGLVKKGLIETTKGSPRAISIKGYRAYLYPEGDEVRVIRKGEREDST